VIETDLFGCHGFRFYDLLDGILPGDLEHDLVGFTGIYCPMDLASGLGYLPGKNFQVVIQVLDGMQANVRGRLT
jgi:hypothetical protein